MRTLTSLLPSSTGSFTVPRLNAEQREEMNRRAEQFDLERRERKISQRIKDANIPRRYQNARTGAIDIRLVDWSAKLKNGVSDGLIIGGAPGRGKTYSACAILIENASDFTIRFVSMMELLNDFQGAYAAHESRRDVLARYTNVGLLCLDDFGRTQPTERALPLIFEVLDSRIRECRPTIITTQCDPRALTKRLTLESDRDTAAAIVSRLQSFQAVTLSGPDRRGTC